MFLLNFFKHSILGSSSSILRLRNLLKKQFILALVKILCAFGISFSLLVADTALTTNTGPVHVKKDAIAQNKPKKANALAKAKKIYNAKELYNLGLEYSNKSKYSKSIRYFRDCYLKSPLSEEGFLAMVMEVYVLYQQNRFVAAISAADDVLLIRSDKEEDPNFIYTKYLKILAYIQYYLSPAHPLDSTLDGKQQCIDFLKEHATSKYSKPIKEEFLPLLEKRILAKEMYVGMHYLRNNNAVGGANRFLAVLNAKDNEYKPEALYRLMQCYYSLGLPSEAQDRFKKYERIINEKAKESDNWLKKCQILQNKHLKNMQVKS